MQVASNRLLFYTDIWDIYIRMIYASLNSYNFLENMNIIKTKSTKHHEVQLNMNFLQKT